MPWSALISTLAHSESASRPFPMIYSTAGRSRASYEQKHHGVPLRQTSRRLREQPQRPDQG
jgi:hypothetical protein